MYEKFGMHMSEKFRQTIYMHQFYLYGLYSDWYNRYTLASLMVMACILENRYKWQRIDQNTHYCQIECYHIYLWRHRWENNIWLNIFMDSKVNLLVSHKNGPQSISYFVNVSTHMTNYLRNFEF